MPQTPQRPTNASQILRVSWGVLTLYAIQCVSPTLASTHFTEAAQPAVIYWRQNLLTVPYQLNSTNGMSGKSVSLYVSNDRGASWHRVSDALPHVLAFNYRAEQDGEYWFAIHITDVSGNNSHQQSTAGAGNGFEPELRVIVDTTIPRFENLTGQLSDGADLQVRWRVLDANLSAHSCSVEVMTGEAGNWQPVPLASASETAAGIWDGAAIVHVPAGIQPTAVRATVIDLAGNRAVYQSNIETANSVDAVLSSGPDFSNARNLESAMGKSATDSDWTSNSAPTLTFNSHDLPSEPQLWPADRLNNTGAKPIAEKSASITYGMPNALGESNPSVVSARVEALDIPIPFADERPLGIIPTQQPMAAVPFRQVLTNHQTPSPEAATASTDHRSVTVAPGNMLTKSVNSRTFSLEYEFADVSSPGITKVELWGTRDGGLTWQSYAVDDDNRSPLQVTVEGEGEFGFSIVVDGTSGLGGFPPRSGDTPELWIRVDLQRPQAQILSIDKARSDAGEELAIRWEADDDNLEVRPISLFYSSRPNGPWTTIATNLENLGAYNWPLQRHVPRRLYLKLEVRDTAGNIAIFQTSESVVIDNEDLMARWQRLPPVE